jgi:hypothetical protein
MKSIICVVRYRVYDPNWVDKGELIMFEGIKETFGTIIDVVAFLSILTAFLWGLVKGAKKLQKVDIDKYYNGWDLMRTSPWQRRASITMLSGLCVGTVSAVGMAIIWWLLGANVSYLGGHLALFRDRSEAPRTTEREFREKYDSLKVKNKDGMNRVELVPAEKPVTIPVPVPMPMPQPVQAEPEKEQAQEKENIRELYRD